MEIDEAVADRECQANQTFVDCRQAGVRNGIPERQTGLRRWTDKSPEAEAAFCQNRQRVRRDKGKRLQRKRSELLERSFAHVCETGGARRTWICGKLKINKRYLIHVAAWNLGLMLRDLFGIGKPRVLQVEMAEEMGLLFTCLCACRRVYYFLTVQLRTSPDRFPKYDRVPMIDV